MSDSATQKTLKREIKKHVKALLTGKTLAGANVAVSKSLPAQEDEFPAIRVYSLSESVDVFDMSQKRYSRVLNLNIECYASGDDPDSLDDTLETLGEAVEIEMDRDDSFGGLVDSVNLIGADYQYEPVATAPLGVLILRYAIRFYTYAQRLDGQCLDAFKGADIEWAVGHNAAPTDNIIDATDELALP